MARELEINICDYVSWNEVSRYIEKRMSEALPDCNENKEFLSGVHCANSIDDILQDVRRKYFGSIYVMVGSSDE